MSPKRVPLLSLEPFNLDLSPGRTEFHFLLIYNANGFPSYERHKGVKWPALPVNSHWKESRDMFITFTHVNCWHMWAFVFITNANQTSFSMFERPELKSSAGNEDAARVVVNIIVCIHHLHAAITSLWSLNFRLTSKLLFAMRHKHFEQILMHHKSWPVLVMLTCVFWEKSFATVTEIMRKLMRMIHVTRRELK